MGTLLGKSMHTIVKLDLRYLTLCSSKAFEVKICIFVRFNAVEHLTDITFLYMGGTFVSSPEEGIYHPHYSSRQWEQLDMGAETQVLVLSVELSLQLHF